MTGLGTSTRPRASRLRRRAMALVLAGLVLPALAACGATDIPSAAPPRTSTVWVDPPEVGTETPSAEPTAEPTAAPTATAPVQTPFAVGRVGVAVDSYAEARRHFEGARRSRELAVFRSPSGNLFCRLEPDSASCEMKAGRVVPPDATVCAAGGANTIGRLEVDATGARAVCNTSSSRDDRAPELDYRSVALAPGTDFRSGVVCLSEETGVTCVNTANHHGFYIARGTVATF